MISYKLKGKISTSYAIAKLASMGVPTDLTALCRFLQAWVAFAIAIAFPKNNQGGDVMIDVPNFIDDEQALVVKS